MNKIVYVKGGIALNEVTPKLFFDKLNVRAARRFLSSDILEIGGICKRLESKVGFPLFKAHFTDEDLIITFNLESCSLSPSSLENFDSIWSATNQACIESFNDTNWVFWEIEIVTIDEKKCLDQEEPPMFNDKSDANYV